MFSFVERRPARIRDFWLLLPGGLVGEECAGTGASSTGKAAPVKTLLKCPLKNSGDNVLFCLRLFVLRLVVGDAGRLERSGGRPEFPTTRSSLAPPLHRPAHAANLLGAPGMIGPRFVFLARLLWRNGRFGFPALRSPGQFPPLQLFTPLRSSCTPRPAVAARSLSCRPDSALRGICPIDTICSSQATVQSRCTTRSASQLACPLWARLGARRPGSASRRRNQFWIPERTSVKLSRYVRSH